MLKHRRVTLIFGTAMALLVPAAIMAVPHTFKEKTLIKAEEVNANFAALENATPTITAWATYAPAVSNMPAGKYTVAGRWRRVGDSAEIQVSFKLTENLSSAAGWCWGLPNDLQVDATKLAYPYAVLGSGLLYYPRYPENPSANGVQIIQIHGSGSPSCVKASQAAGGNWTVGNGQTYDALTEIEFIATVPVAGWSVK